MRGIVVGTRSLDEAIVQLATAAEVAALARQRAEVQVIETPPPARGQGLNHLPGSEIFIRTNGTYVRVGVVTTVSFASEMLDITSFGDSNRRTMRGLPRVTGEFVGL